MKKTEASNKKATILIVDDDEGIRMQLKWALNHEFRVLEAQTKDEAIYRVRNETVNLVTLDISLSTDDDTDGMLILEEIIQCAPQVKVIMITGNNQKQIARTAIQNGAHDFYQKPIDIDEIKTIIKRALYVQKLELENEALIQQVTEQTHFADIIGDCPQILDVFDMMRRVINTDVPILITGESGTGKELVARAIHYQSQRNNKPFVAINCGAIPENLLESELFGHEKGAFTGAYFQKKGKFELANGGTAFLDEIAELNPTLQVKLLRFLQEKQIERVGGKQLLPVDVRIVAATNRDLNAEIAKENFRLDLFYRLGVIAINLPPLRERGSDITLLANFFLQKYIKEYGKKIHNFDSLALKTMQNYSWPGNVRELENRVKRAVIMAQKRLISCKDLDFSENSNRKKESLVEVMDDVQKKYIERALNRTQGNVSKAARELGISRVTLYDLLGRLKIDVKDYRKKKKTDSTYI